MNKIFGTYCRSKEQQKWHWQKECPDYPHSDMECMVSTKAIHTTELCEQCLGLDVQSTGTLSLLSARAEEYSAFIKNCFEFSGQNALPKKLKRLP